MMLVNPYAVQPAGSGGSAVDPTFSNVKLLMHCEGTVGTQTYTDNSSYTRTLAGNSQALVDNTRNYRGSSSIFIAGPVNLNVPFNATIGGDEWARMGTDAHPLTIEMAIWPDSPAAARFLAGAGNSGPGAGYWWGIALKNATTISLLEQTYGVSDDADVSLTTSISTSGWQMLAIACRGTAHREIGVWLDGVWQGSAVSTKTPVVVGSGSADDKSLNFTRTGAQQQYTGSFDEIRVSEELFLPWGSNYTPQAGAFPDS